MYNPNLDRIKPLTYAKFVQENERWNSLTPEQQKAEYDSICSSKEDIFETIRIERAEERKQRHEQMARQAYIGNRSPNAPTKDEAVVLWLVAIVVGAIFNAGVFIWIIASVSLFLYLSLETRRAIKWDNGGKEEYYNQLKNANKKDG